MIKINLEKNDFEESKKEYIVLKSKMENSESFTDRKGYGKLSKRFYFLEKLIEKINKKEEIDKNIKDNKLILKKERDEELIKLIEEEIENLKNEKNKIEKEIVIMTSGNSNSEESVLVEIRAGAGGEESSLFAQTLFDAYQKFCKKMGFEINIFDISKTDLGGLKEISFEINGKKAKEWFKYEGGVHRVQRIPATEKKGRIHTSTTSVVVLEKPEKEEIKINPQDLKIETFRASGPGGQYVNKRESAIRITHIPSGIVVASQAARTQVENRENALSLLEAKLFDSRKEEEERKLGAARKSQAGHSMRSEKIRTYNFPQDRITDHRIKKSWGHIEEILNGNLDKIIKTLKKR